ncbi:MAG: hypothetical protein JNM85_01335 [Chthonomonas sp.]|nr:hypothetical protein [Chthonomonas sp.]
MRGLWDRICRGASGSAWSAVAQAVAQLQAVERSATDLAATARNDPEVQAKLAALRRELETLRARTMALARALGVAL